MNIVNSSIFIMIVFCSCKNNTDNNDYRQKIINDAVSRAIEDNLEKKDSIFIANMSSNGENLLNNRNTLCLKIEQSDLKNQLYPISCNIDIDESRVFYFNLTDSFIPPKSKSRKVYIQYSPLLELDKKAYVAVGRIKSGSSIWSEIYSYSIEAKNKWNFLKVDCGYSPY